MCEQALEIAQQIAANSPIAVIGTKDNLIYARDHSVAEGLKYEATWNMVMLQTEVSAQNFAAPPSSLQSLRKRSAAHRTWASRRGRS